MIKSINFGKTPFNELYQVFNLDNMEGLENKRARLFPSGNTDNECATTSIFLSSLSAVKEYREELLKEIGINKITNLNVQLHTFTELKNKETGDRPDGLIVLTTGKKNPVVEWACLVEAKVKKEIVKDEQVEKYSDFARKIGIDTIITISNELVPNPSQSPNKINKKKFNLFHWSWIYLRVVGNVLIKNDRIEDVDHIFILSELQRYFKSHKKLFHYVDMGGKEWNKSVTHLRQYEYQDKKDCGIISFIAKSYAQEEKDISLHLTDSSNLKIELITRDNRIERIEKQLHKNSKIISKYMINKNRKNKFSVEINFPKQEVICSTEVRIENGKAVAKTSSLIKMLEVDSGITDKIRIEAYYPRNKKVDRVISLAQLSNEKSNGMPYSVINKNYGPDIDYFKVKTVDNLGRDFKHPKKFIIALEAATLQFLQQIMENKRV